MPAETDPALAVLTDQEAEAQARRIIADFATSYRDETPTPKIGTAAPVQQPGRPAMTPRATDASVMMVAAGWLSLCLGTAVSAVLHFSSGANETVVICLCSVPPVTLLALGRLLRRAKEVVEAAPVEVHQHFHGAVHQDQRQVDSKSYGVVVRTDNRQ